MNYIKDVALYNEDDTVNVIIEICPDTSDKNELVEPEFNRLKCVRQVEGKYPFYYGSFPQTLAGDKDPLDMILFTDIKHQLLDLVKVDVIGAVRTIDAGEQDDKIICVETSCGLKNVKKQMKAAMKFLKSYKGKNADMKIEKKLASMEYADSLVKEANELYMQVQNRVVSTRTVNNIRTTSTNTTSGVRIVRR